MINLVNSCFQVTKTAEIGHTHYFSFIYYYLSDAATVFS